jgi:hypothetical protein
MNLKKWNKQAKRPIDVKQIKETKETKESTEVKDEMTYRQYTRLIELG